ncbi:hypothetical protein pb186bvf_011873 [Paramecium bursaria]
MKQQSIFKRSILLMNFLQLSQFLINIYMIIPILNIHVIKIQEPHDEKTNISNPRYNVFVSSDNLHNSFNSIIRQSSHEALLKSNDARVSQLSINMNILISRAFEQVNLALNKVQQLNNNELNTSQYIRDCWVKQNNTGIILTYCNNQDEQVEKTSDHYNNNRNLLNQMDQFLLSFLLDQLSQFQILYRIQKPHLTSLFALTQIQQNFNIETRPYYQETLKQNNTRYIVNPYINQETSKLSIMITQTIYDQFNNPDMIMGIGLQLDIFEKYLSLNNIKFVLCTHKGIIMISNLDNTLLLQTVTSKIFLFNQTTFPFNQDDWNQLTSYLQNKTYQSNCQLTFLKFCRNLNGSDTQIEATIIQKKFIQIIFNDLSFTEQENKQMENNISQLIGDATKMLIVFFPSSFGLLLISSIILAYLIKPAVEMIHMIDLQIKSSFEYVYCCDLQQRRRNSIFKSFQNSFTELIQRNINQKNKSIKTFNQYRYPLANKLVELDYSGTLQLNKSLQLSPRLKKSLIKQIAKGN